MTYLVEVKQYGQVVQVERLGSLAAAQSVARSWQAKGFQVRITDDHNASYPGP